MTIWADNLRPAPQDPWQVVIDVASADGSMGTLGSVTPRSVNANWETHKGTIEFVVPDIYLPPTHAAVPVNAGPEFEADHALRLIAAAKRISIVRTGARSNAIPILIKSPHYVLQSLSPAMAHQGDVVTVTGTNYWEPVAGQRYIGYFDLGPRGRVAAAKTEGVSSTTFKLTVPWDLFNGFIQARRAGVLLVREPMGIASNALRVNLVYQRPPPPSDPCPQKVDPPNCNLAGQSNGRATCFANRYWCCGQNAPEDSDLADTAQICDVGFHPYGGICDPGRTPSQGGCLKISAP